MELGWLDVCLRVVDVARSREFYAKLGFVRVEGDDEQGWAVVVNGEHRIGLFEATFMGDDSHSINFRGGDVMAIGAHLIELGVEFETLPKMGRSGGASASLRDPDGNLIFFDTGSGEQKRMP